MGVKSLETYSPLTKRQATVKDVDWVRSDGRNFQQCRPAFLRTGAVNAASGSAYAEFGKTKVIVSVFGPRESKKALMFSDTGRLNCNVTYTAFAVPNRCQGLENKEFSSMLHKALEGAIILESFPKTTVDVFALVLESGGSKKLVTKGIYNKALDDTKGLTNQQKVLDRFTCESDFYCVVLRVVSTHHMVYDWNSEGDGDLPVVISCASLALADAGIMMYDLVSSVSVSCLGKNLVIDPTSEEESSYQDGSLMITCMPSRNEVTQLTLSGEWSTPKIHEAMELCLNACAKLGEIMSTCLKETASALQE